MRDFRDAKAMAQTLREALKPKSVSLTHSESLELVAKMLGFHDWNVLSAHIQVNPEKDRTRTPVGIDLPIVPCRDIVLFPNMGTPLFVGRDSTKRALECAMAGDRRVLAVTQRRAGDDDPDPSALYGVGVIATVIDLIPDSPDHLNGRSARRHRRGVRSLARCVGKTRSPSRRRFFDFASCTLVAHS